MLKSKKWAWLAGFMVVSLILAACTPQQVEVPVTVVVEKTKEVQVVQTVEVALPTGTPALSFTTPHPILGDLRNRQGIAFCTNREELIASVYPYVEDKSGLLMDAFVPTTHWAYTKPSTQYPFDPEKGKALFDEAGWKLEEGAPYRTNATGDPMILKWTTTTAQFRQTWGAVFEANMAACGLQILRFHTPASYWFGSTSGLRRRDFELGAFAWVGEPDPKGDTLYACNQIPRPENNWEGQNYMGWCNETASKAIIAANSTLDRQVRIDNYAIFHEEFAKDMPSLPVFQRAEAEAATTNLLNWTPDPTEYMTHNAYQWELADGGDTVVIGFSQEPATMFSLVESAAVQRIAVYLVQEPFAYQKSYDYQPNLWKQLPTVENGGATNDTVEVKEGDIVYSTSGEPVELKAGVELVDADGNTVTYSGGTVNMQQLTITYEAVDGLTWSDGEPVKQADWELAFAVDCDHESGAVGYTLCDNLAQDGVTFNSDTSFTIKYAPGFQYPLYFAILPIANGPYPSHQVLADGRKLADVPHKDWGTLPEIAECPLGYGPYVLACGDWVKGQSLTFHANPNYFRGEPKVKTIVIQLVADSQTAAAQFLQGQLDVLEKATLGAGAEVQAVLDAQKAGQPIKVEVYASPTWEHIDMNLFVK
jgi:ABC-type transport system substrate-binding protein